MCQSELLKTSQSQYKIVLYKVTRDNFAWKRLSVRSRNVAIYIKWQAIILLYYCIQNDEQPKPFESTVFKWKGTTWRDYLSSGDPGAE